MQKLRDENEALRLENKKLCDERLAMRNIIEDERRKNKKKAETMQSRINRLNQDLEQEGPAFRATITNQKVMEEKKKPTAAELCGKLSESIKANDIVAMGFSENEATYIVGIYKKGIEEYKWDHYNLQQKYQKLCVAVCEKLLMSK